ncbi:MAG: M1 family metallopeptidase, partial [Deltaproteobacteria bacterium]|nr:M1 family metallopeptidase [Deltaproteobacteria bacterium]
VITFQKEAPISRDLADNLINPRGIALTDAWHPIPEKEMLFKLTAGIPAEFEAVSEADAITAAPSPEGKRVTFRFDHPLRTIHFAAGPYVKNRVSFAPGKDLFTYFFPEDQGLADAYLAKAYHYLNRYETLLGPYPFRRFSVVENRLPTGFAVPTFTLLGQAVVRLPFIKDTSLGHEVLHAWFGNG